MTFLKVKDGIVNLAAIKYVRRVQNTITLYFRGDFYDISFEREEEAEEYLSALGTLLDAKEPEVKSDRSAAPIFTETEGDAVELAFEAASRFGRYKEKEAMAWIREKSKLVAAAVQRIGFLELCDSVQPDVIRGQLRAIFAAEKSRAIDTGVVIDSATQPDLGKSKGGLRICQRIVKLCTETGQG